MPAKRQEEWLVTFSGGLHVDELALDWDAGWRLMDQWVELDWLSVDNAASFRPIDEAFAAMSAEQQRDLWTLDALHTAVEWLRIRELAKSALFEL